MCSKRNSRLATSFLYWLTVVFGGTWMITGTPVMAVELVIMEAESQVLDLDTGNVIETSPVEDPTAPAGGDFKLAYNADRSPHAVVFPTGDGVELAFVADVGFDGVSAADIPNLAFSSEPTDLPFSASDCVVIRTDQGALFRLGNALENGTSITFNYARLQ